MIAKPVCEEHGPKRYFLGGEGSRSWKCDPCIRRWSAEYRRAHVAETLVSAKRYRATAGGRLRVVNHALRHEGHPTLTHSEFAPFWESFRGLCEVCGDRITRSAHIDHDHSTGRLRGWLCSSCNLTIGHSLESPRRLLAVLAYLEAAR